MAPVPPSILTPAPTPKELQQEILLLAVGDRLKATEADLASLKSLVSAKNVQITRLETDNVRLKMLRADKELAVQVEGLRHEVGRKDRELVDLRRKLEAFQENEKITLHRAAVAEQKVATVQNTLVTMQRSRDAAHLKVEEHERDRLEAVRTMVHAQDRAKVAEAKLVELEKRTKVVIDNRHPKGQGRVH